LSKTPTYNKSISLKDDSKKETSVFRAGNVDELVSGLFDSPEVTNLQKLYLKLFYRFEKARLIAHKEIGREGISPKYKYRTFEDIFNLCRNIGSALVGKGIIEAATRIKRDDMRLVGICSENREEWFETDIICALYGLASVPIDPNIEEKKLKDLFDIIDLSIIFCSSGPALKIIANRKEYPSLKTIICFDEVPHELHTELEGDELKIYQWSELQRFTGREVMFPYILSDAVYTIIFDYNELGAFKGTLITHENMIASIAGFLDQDNDYIQGMSLTDSYLSYIPLTEIFERTMLHCLATKGAHISFYSKGDENLMEALRCFKPSFFIGFQRTYRDFYFSILQEIEKEKGDKSDSIMAKIKAKMEKLQKKGSYHEIFFDNVQFDAYKSMVGGRLKCCFSIGGPLSPFVADFLKVCLSVPICEAYGRVETCGFAAVQIPTDTAPGRVGAILPNVEFTLVDYGKLGFTTNNKFSLRRTPRGEIWLGQSTKFRGYYKEEKSQTWLKTGDIGQINSDGTLSILGQKDTIFRLANDEPIFPEKVEEIYRGCRHVNDIFIYGENMEELVAIINPHKSSVEKWARDLDLKGDFSEICGSKFIRDLMLVEIEKFAKEVKLEKSFFIKNVHLEPHSFSSLGLYDSHMHLNRSKMVQHYAKKIHYLYQEKNPL